MDKETIENTYPELGKLRITLHDYSSKIYRILDRNKINEISRYKKLPHLGLISEVYEGTHHSKWEYIFLQIFLFQKMEETKSGLGLSQNSNLRKYKNLTVLDLLQAWSLLLNLGHLTRTFEEERTWFEEILLNKTLQEKILATLPNEQTKTKFKRTLERQDYMEFYQYLAVLYVVHTLERRVKYEEYQLILDILLAWFEDAEQSQKLGKAKKLFRSLRFSAHVYLDCRNMPSFMKINPHLMLASMEEDPLRWSGLKGNYRPLSPVHQHLYETFYLSPNVKKMYVNYRDFIRPLLRSRYIVNSRVDSQRFLKELLQRRHNPIKERIQKGSWQHKKRFIIPPTPFGKRYIRYFNIENQLNKNAIDWTLLVTPNKTTEYTSATIDLLVKQTETGSIQPIRNILKYLEEELSSDMKLLQRVIGDKDPRYLNLLYQNLLQDIFFYILEMFLPEKLSVRFKEKSKLTPVNCSLKKSTHKSLLKSIRTEINGSVKNKFDKHELECTLDWMRKEMPSSTVFLILQPIIILDSDMIMKAEIDGMIMNIMGNSVKLTLIEAKKTRKSSKQSTKKQLDSTLEKINAKNKIMKYGAPRYREKGYAHTTIYMRAR